jgi:hypothetical protein
MINILVEIVKIKITVAALSIFMAFSFSGFSQTKGQKKDEMPSKQELEQMMKEMEQEMEDMDPEEKEMLKKMGIQMSD